MRRCPACGEENPERFRFCGICGAELAPAVAPADTRKTVTVLFTDLKGSTAMAERLEPEVLRSVLRRYFTAMQAVIERHGGSVEKYIGDAIVAVFGLPRAHEDDAMRAVRAASEMQEALAVLNLELERAWDVTIQNRTGVNTGEVVAGDVTAGQRLVSGDAVNVAARFEQAAGTNEVLLGESTYRLVRDAVDARRVEPLELKGKSEPMPAYRLVGVLGTEGYARRLDAPIVGRTEQLGALTGAFARAVGEGSCRMVTLLGPAGVGKSRLLQEFARATGDEVWHLRGRCLPYGDGITFWPLAEAVKDAAGVTESDTPEQALGKLGSLAHEEIAAPLAAAFGLAPGSFPLEETFWAARKLFERLAGSRPLVVDFEDIHWAEPTFLDLVEHLVRESDEVPILILCTSRTELLEERPDWGDLPNASAITLEPLTPEESRQVVANLLGGEAPAELADRIVRASGGNPLYVEQILSMLIDDGTIRRQDHRWIATRAVARIRVPPTISALLVARLDRLADDDRVALQRGAVIGEVFGPAAIRSLVDAPLRDRVEANLASLVRKQLIERAPSTFVDEDAFRFRHLLIKDAAYEGLLKQDRASLHERFANWMETEAGIRTDEQEEIIGYHLEQAASYGGELSPNDDHVAELAGRAAERLASAGRRALARWDLPAAASLLARAADVLPEGDVRRVTLLPDLADVLGDLGDFRGAERRLGEALGAARQRGDVRLEAEARLVALSVRFATEPESWNETSFAEVEAAIPTLEAAHDHRTLARAWHLLGSVHGTACRYASAERAVFEAMRHAGLAGDRRLRSRGITALTICAVYGPTPVPEAIERCETALLEAEEAKDRRAASIVRCTLAHLNAMRGGFEIARELYERARANLVDLGGTVLAASTSLDSGPVELLAGDLARAEAELRRDFDALAAVGETYLRSTISGLLAHTLLAAERREEADRFARAAEAMAADDDVESQVLWRTARARLHAEAGDPEAAISVARGAVDLILATENPNMQGNAFLDLARVLRVAGRHEEAAGVAARARAAFEAKGAVVSVRKAAALEELIAAG